MRVSSVLFIYVLYIFWVHTEPIAEIAESSAKTCFPSLSLTLQFSMELNTVLCLV